MKGQIAEYLESLYRDIPMYVYEGLLSVLCLGMIVIFACYGLKCGWKKIAGLILAEYVFLIICSTVIFRAATDGNGHNFTPFWSYEAVKYGKVDLIAENIMNVVVFVPVGMLLGLITMEKRNGWRTRIARISLIVGVGLMISGSIEVLQFFLKRGFSEFDDVFHNTLGCLIGFMIVLFIERLWLLLKRY